MKNALMMMTTLLLLGCVHTAEKEQVYFLQGAWTLRHVKYPSETEYGYSLESSGTVCLIYDRDSTLYECQLVAIPSGLVFMPTVKREVTLINKGGGELLYLEDGDPHPLTISSDSTITIQRNGILYSWVRADDIYEEWGADMRDIIARDVENEDAAYGNRYVLSAKERQQENTIHWLVYALGFILILSVQYVVANQRSKRQLQLQLRQIQEAHDERAQSVRQAMVAEEEKFFTSDEYVALQKRMADGQLLKEQDWANVEQLLKTVYPGFTTQLRGLHPMSELEYQTCLLVKLRIAPKDMAAVLARDVSTISTVRSRLYKKVFGRKGSTKEWDDFILSIGA